jgi:hypothetical protein
MRGYKGFNKNMKCLDFQYEVGKTYEIDSVEICSKGFHFCENPLDVLDYYSILDSDAKNQTFAEILAEKDITPKDKKRACSKITIGAELDIKGLIKASVDFMFEDNNVVKIKYNSQLAASGDFSQLAASGDFSQLAAAGDNSQLAASGYNSKLAASGYSSQLAASGDNSVVAGIGIDNTAKAVKGCWIVLAEWVIKNDKRIPKCVKSVKVDGKKIKENTYYKLDGGKFKEVK